MAQGKSVKYSAMRWGEITERFNRRFEGQHLPGVKTPRPSRTKVGLRTERSRVRKITDYTGLPFRVPKSQGGSKRMPRRLAKEGFSEEGDHENGTDGEEEEQDPRGTRRGDSPPGKKPWRKDGDNEDGTGGGLGQPIHSSEIGV